jgi:hypothetical protein
MIENQMIDSVMIGNRDERDRAIDECMNGDVTTDADTASRG